MAQGGGTLRQGSRSARRGLSRTVTERRQRSRLEAAMVESGAARGYAQTTGAELARIAAVSKSTFYDHFRDKEDCFSVTLDTIVDEVSARVGVTFRSQTGVERSLAAALSKFADFLVGESDAASLAFVDSLSLGAEAV